MHVGAFRTASACLLLTLPFGGVGTAAPEDESLESPQLVEQFDDRGFDRRRWSIDLQSPPGVRLDLDRDRLHVVIPAGASNRPYAVFSGQFELVGDFQITADYTLKAFPAPTDPTSLKCEIFVEGPDGAASVMRERQAEVPGAHTMWAQPPAESEKSGAYGRVDTSAQSGSLRMVREGSTLQFFAAGPDGRDFLKLGETDFGTAPIPKVQLRVSAPEIATPADVTFDNVRLAFDEIVPPLQPAETSDRTWLWVGLAIAVAAVVGLLIFFWRRAA